MRLEPSEPTNESGFYARLREATLGDLYLERVEPANESGFPDVYFTFRHGRGGGEGTIELKFADAKEPNLRSLCRGNQKAALLEYSMAGGRRRFALCYCNGVVYLWDTEDFHSSLRTDGKKWTDTCVLRDPGFRQWLLNHLEDKNYE